METFMLSVPQPVLREPPEAACEASNPSFTQVPVRFDRDGRLLELERILRTAFDEVPCPVRSVEDHCRDLFEIACIDLAAFRGRDSHPSRDGPGAIGPELRGQ
eukprot:4541017-Lingulodinium_polyedra.AAC.1